MSLRLFNLGFPKSGTSTLTYALEKSGLRCAHCWLKRIGPRPYVAQRLWSAWRDGLDPMFDLRGIDAVTQPDATFPGTFVCWPQMVPDLVADLRRRHPQAVLLLLTRDPACTAASMARWKDYRARPVEARIPGLPAGIGAEDGELAAWIDGHYADCRARYGADPRFLEADIADPHTPQRIADALGIKRLAWWGVRNANPQ